MSGKRSSTHCTNFGRVCATIVEDADADLLFACEVGAFRQGLSKAKIHVEDILKKPFGDSVRFAEVNNYLSLWGFGGASQPALVSLHGDTKIYQVPIGRQVDAVIARFDVQTSGHGRVHVVTGNMHIVCAEHPPSVLARQRAVRLLRLHLDGLEAPEVDTPVVRIMVGDNNLNSQQAREALQRHADDEAFWEVFASPADRIGDNVAVCGAVASFRPIAVGASYLDRGMRNDSHDAVAVVITLRGASQPAEAKKREPAFGTFSDSEVSVSRSRSPSPTPTARSEADGKACDETEDEVRAQDLHSEMRKYWEQRYDAHYDPKLLHHLSLLLFKKRKSAQPAEGDSAGAPQPGSDYDTAFASQAETARAIQSVLRVRHEFLRSKNIADLRHVLTEAERGELVKRAREEYEQSEHQLALQDRDAEKGKGKGKTPPKGSRGAPHPTSKGSKAQGTGKGSLAKFLKDQRRKRWCRHLQRVCGTKQIWEVLAFSGRFDVDMLRRALHVEPSDEAAEPPARDEVSHEQRRRLHHDKAEAIARYNEGERLARHRQELQRRGASQPASHDQEVHTFTRRQLDVLQKWESGELLSNRNKAILAVGHGRLRSARGDYLDIGGSTGGGSRRIIDSWQPPDWRDFLQDEREA